MQTPFSLRIFVADGDPDGLHRQQVQLDRQGAGGPACAAAAGQGPARAGADRGVVVVEAGQLNSANTFAA